jgi:hypothetical protein
MLDNCFPNIFMLHSMVIKQRIDFVFSIKPVWLLVTIIILYFTWLICTYSGLIVSRGGYKKIISLKDENSDEPVPVRRCVPHIKKRKKFLCFTYRKKPDPWWKKLIQKIRRFFNDDAYRHIRFIRKLKYNLNVFLENTDMWLNLHLPWIKIIYNRYILTILLMLFKTVLLFTFYYLLCWVFGLHIIDVLFVEYYKPIKALSSEYHFIKAILLHDNLICYHLSLYILIVYIIICFIRMVVSWLIVKPSLEYIRYELFIMFLAIWFVLLNYFCLITYNEFFVAFWLWWHMVDIGDCALLFFVGCCFIQFACYPDFFFGDAYREIKIKFIYLTKQTKFLMSVLRNKFFRGE